MSDLYHQTDKALSSAKRYRLLTYGDDTDKLLLALFDSLGDLLESVRRGPEEDS